MKNTKEQLAEARKGIPFTARYKNQDYIVYDVAEVKDPVTRNWVFHYLYVTTGELGRIFSREIKEFNKLFSRDKK